MFVWYFYMPILGSKRKFNSRSNLVETTHVFWKRCKFQPRVLNVKKARCSLAPSMRSESLCEQLTSGDVSGCVAFWFVKSPLPTTWTRCHVIHNINHVTKRLTPSHHHLIKIPNRKLVHANKFSILRPPADPPLLVWLLLLLKSEHRSVVPSRKNTRQMNMITGTTIYSQNTDLNLDVQAKFKQNINLVICHVYSPSRAIESIVLRDDYLR